VVLRFLFKNADLDGAASRHRCGQLAGGVGLAANILLFATKLTIGMMTASIAVVADAFNNLSDAGSSVVTLAGFRLSAAPPDREHPFGHGRFEYLTAMGIAVMVIFAGWELVQGAVDKIVHPVAASFDVWTPVILCVAMAVKLWMSLFYRRIGKLIGSSALLASAVDSRNDVVCTGAVLVSSIVGRLSGWHIDGYMGLLVALFIIWSGVSMVRDTVSPLLGQAPDPELTKSIRQTVMDYEGILGVHDLIVHNYGPGQYMISLHAEVSDKDSMMHSHDLIDRVENELKRKYNAVACIHMDPLDSDDPNIAKLRALVMEQVNSIDPMMSIHDFRVVQGETHTNLIFDLVVPFELMRKKRPAELAEEVQRLIWKRDEKLFAVITVEHSYI